MSNICLFCKENRFTLNKAIGLGDSPIIYEDEHVFITPDIAPIVMGHFLIVTKQHWYSFGNTNKEIFDSLEKAKQYLKNKVFIDKPVLFFEHGAVLENTAGASIDHAHMHAMPFNADMDIDGYIKNSKFVSSIKYEADFNLLNNWAISKQPYIYYEIEKKYAYKVGKLPSQFMRTMIAFYFKKQYDWKKTYKEDSSKNLFKRTLILANQ